jgi:hypothetical protein
MLADAGPSEERDRRRAAAIDDHRESDNHRWSAT